MGMSVQQDIGSSNADDGDSGEAVVAEINITPLTDVFLVLLIIFMVTSTAVIESAEASRAGVKVALPRANAAGQVTKKRTDPIITVTKTGDIFLFNKKLDPANLEDEIRKALTEVGSETLLLRVDKNVLTGATVHVMGVGKKAGAKNIAILTQEGDSK